MKIASRRNNQKGSATLITVVILLIVLLIPVVTSMKYTQTNEQMLASTIDRSRTFQAAEAALVEAESYAATNPTFPTTGCSAGLCGLPSGAPPWKDNATFWTSGPTRTASSFTDGVTSKYIVEFLGMSTGETDDCTTSGDVSPDATCEEQTARYRITVFSKSNSNAEVFLQSNLLAP